MITTERLVLRRFRPSDAPALAAYRADPEVARYQSWEPSAPVPDFTTGTPDTPGWFQYAIEHDTLIGDVGVNTHENLMQAEIGVTLARAAQGSGFAAEAVTGVLGHLFRVRGLHRVSAECDARNTASARLLERLGFTREGVRREHSWFKGEWTDDVMFGLLDREFFKIKS